MQVLQAGYLAGDDEDGKLEWQSKVNSVAVLLPPPGAMTSSRPSSRAHGPQCLWCQDRRPVAAGGKAALPGRARAGLRQPDRRLRQVEQAQNNAQTAAQVTLRQQQDKVAAATGLLVASGKAIASAKEAERLEQRLILTRDADAAPTLDATAAA